jgi:hypothetical protein
MYSTTSLSLVDQIGLYQFGCHCPSICPIERFGLAIGTSSKKGTTNASCLCRQMLGLLEIIFPKEGEIPAMAMATLQTIWVVLYQWPAKIVQNKLIHVWEQGMIMGNNMHATIR